MKRDLLQKLIEWKTHPFRVPIILRGARQVGKSWLIQEFSKTFESFVEINFDKEEKAKILFEGDIDIPTLVEKLSLFAEKPIIPGKTLLFFDEAQECPNSIKALRYFKEEFNELHVIAAGSLLDFLLENIGVPVGRVQFMYLYPLSFGEFLTASNREDLRQYIATKPVDPVIHEKILEYLKTYMWLGGLPQIVNAWISSRDIQFCQQMQDRIILAYQQDFHKYAKENLIEFVDKVFDSIPHQLGQKFKYSNVDQDIPVYPLKKALKLLIKAGIAHVCYHTSGQAIPLGATKNEKKFKIFFVDIGLAQRLLGLDLKEWVTTPFELKYLGSMAEQLVAQEFIAYTSHSAPPQLYYWHRESKNSNAEVDFLFVRKSQIIPIEVKSGVKGGMKSLKVFLDTHPKSTFGLKVSEGLASKQEHITEIAFYNLEGWLTISSVFNE